MALGTLYLTPCSSLLWLLFCGVPGYGLWAGCHSSSSSSSSSRNLSPRLPMLPQGLGPSSWWWPGLVVTVLKAERPAVCHQQSLDGCYLLPWWGKASLFQGIGSVRTRP